MTTAICWLTVAPAEAKHIGGVRKASVSQMHNPDKDMSIIAMWGAPSSALGSKWTPKDIDDALFEIEDDAQKGAGENWNPLTTPLVFFHEDNIDMFKGDGIELDQRLSKQGFVHLYIPEFASGSWLPRVLAAGIQSLQIRQSRQNLPSAFHGVRTLFCGDGRQRVDKAVRKLAGARSTDLNIKTVKIHSDITLHGTDCRKAVDALPWEITHVSTSDEADLSIEVINQSFRGLSLSKVLELVHDRRRAHAAKVHITLLSFSSDSHSARFAPYVLAALDPSVKILYNPDTGALTGAMVLQSYTTAIKEALAQHDAAPLFYSQPHPSTTVELGIETLANASQHIHAAAIAKALAL